MPPSCADSSRLALTGLRGAPEAADEASRPRARVRSGPGMLVEKAARRAPRSAGRRRGCAAGRTATAPRAAHPGARARLARGTRHRPCPERWRCSATCRRTTTRGWSGSGARSRPIRCWRRSRRACTCRWPSGTIRLAELARPPSNTTRRVPRHFGDGGAELPPARSCSCWPGTSHHRAGRPAITSGPVCCASWTGSTTPRRRSSPSWARRCGRARWVPRSPAMRAGIPARIATSLFRWSTDPAAQERYTADPGSDSDDKLQLLAVIGAQSMRTSPPT